MPALEKNTYDFPKSEGYKRASLKMIPAYICGLAGVVATIWVGVEFAASRELWASLSVTLVVLAISGWGTYWYGWRFPMAKAEIDGVTLVYKHKDYYAPPEVFKEKVLDPLYESFRPHVDFDPQKLVQGSTVILTPAKPHYKGPRIGVTTPSAKVTRVYGPYILDRGGTGYELRLIGCHVLFPGRSEGEDIEWMKENNVA